MEKLDNNDLVEVEEELTIKIQTLDNLFPLTVEKQKSILDIKKLIKQKFNVNEDRQKLIYQGKVLTNEDQIKATRIINNSVLHLVVKPEEENEEEPEEEDQEEGVNNVEDVLNSIIEIPIIRTGRRRRRPTTTFDISDCFEAMHQNITTLNNIIKSKTKFNESEIAQTKTIVPYDFSKFKYEPGQWLDVKDTIDQWIEAQVIHVRGNEAFIHYNGWGTRWDEYIDFSSSRIAPFKTYSVNNNPGGCFSSPYPSIVPDAGGIEPLQRSLETFYYIDKAYGFINEVKKNIEDLYKIKKKCGKVFNSDLFYKFNEEKEEKYKYEKNNFNINNSNANVTTNKFTSLLNNNFVSKDKEKEREKENNQGHNFLSNNDLELLHNITQLIPIMDRVGRYISDVSLHLSQLVTNPNLYPKLILGYNGNFYDDSKSCTSGYSMFTNEGSVFSNYDHNIIRNNMNSNSNTSNQVINSLRNNVGLSSQNNLNNQNVINENNTSKSSSKVIKCTSKENQCQIKENEVNTNSNNINNLETINNIQSVTTEISNVSNLNPIRNHNQSTILQNISQIQSSNQINTSLTNNLNLENKQQSQETYFSHLPKINLQLPAVQHMNFTQTAYSEPNFELYVHTMINPTNLMGNVPSQNIEEDQINSVRNSNNNNEIGGRRISHRQLGRQSLNSINTTRNIISHSTNNRIINQDSFRANCIPNFNNDEIQEPVTHSLDNEKNNDLIEEKNEKKLPDEYIYDNDNYSKYLNTGYIGDENEGIDKSEKSETLSNNVLTINNHISNLSNFINTKDTNQTSNTITENIKTITNINSNNNTSNIFPHCQDDILSTSSKEATNLRNNLSKNNNVISIQRLNELHSTRQNRLENKGDAQSISSVTSNTHSVCSTLKRNLISSEPQQLTFNNVKDLKE